MRKAFNFYQSHWEQIKLLSDTQKLDLFNAICSVQFLEVSIEDISFKDNISSLIWIGIKHSINTSIKGFVNKNKSLNKDIIVPLTKGGTKAPNIPPYQQLEEKEEEKEQLVSKKSFSFSLSKNTQLINTSVEYKNKLKEYISNNFKGMTYEEFYNNCEMKGYKYKNYKLVYDKWNNKYNKDRSISERKLKDPRANTIDERFLNG